MLIRRNKNIITAAILCVVLNIAIAAQTSEFTYQGKLVDQNVPANGVYDLSFKLYDSASLQIGSTVAREDVQVTDGIFTVALDFGAAAFDGGTRTIEISVRPGTSTSSFTALSPKQPISSTPYAVKSLKAGTADTASNASQLGGVNANQFVQTNDLRLTDSRNPLAGSASYIQNGATRQALSTFNVSGHGIVGGRLGVGGTQAPTKDIHVRGQEVRVEGFPSNIYPRFSHHFTGPGTDEGKWQNYASERSLRFSALNDAENSENIWLIVNRDQMNIRDISFPFGKVGIGTTAPATNLHVMGQDIRIQSSETAMFPRFSHVFAGGATDTKKWQNYATQNSLVFSALNDAETAEQQWLRVNRLVGTNIITNIEFIAAFVRIQNLAGGGSSSICRDSTGQLAVCSSSIRYKNNVEDYAPGLELINKLRPVSFNWKADDKADLGLVAEEVADVEPLLVTRNDKGEVEGVKYDRVGVVLVNAVKEQQAQLDAQAETIRLQQRQIAGLTKLVCTSNPRAEICTGQGVER